MTGDRIAVDACKEADVALQRTFAARRRRWDQYLDLLDNPPVHFEIPYESASMPGWFFAATGVGPHPTPIIATVTAS